jgi:hypothetical protein
MSFLPTIIISLWLLLWISLLLLPRVSNAFLVVVPVANILTARSQGYVVARFSTSNNNNNNNNMPLENNDNADEVRNMLEVSWNIPTMGPVPTNPDVAAAAAGTFIKN